MKSQNTLTKKSRTLVFLFLGLGLPALAAAAGAQAEVRIASKPLFRDPVYDGAADPVVLWNRENQRWFMYYTNRRANLPADQVTGVTWVHGTHIGIAESTDGGAHWTYRGTTIIPYGGEDMTHWAPEVLFHDGTYHMYLTFVPGIFDTWQHPRTIVHLTSEDGVAFDYQSTLNLSSEACIDACVIQLDDGTWRMWYNNERDGKSIYYADSPDLYSWTDRGKVSGVGERPGEGPKVFRWHGRYWMAVDIWDGLGIYRSDDAETWTVQPHDLLQVPGTGPDDTAKGQHPDVVVNHGRAYLFYFTHPDRSDPRSETDLHAQRRSSIQVVELKHGEDGWLHADREQPTRINLQPPE